MTSQRKAHQSIRCKRQHAEDQVAEYFPVSPHSQVPPSELLLQPPAGPLDLRPLAVGRGSGATCPMLPGANGSCFRSTCFSASGRALLSMIPMCPSPALRARISAASYALSIRFVNEPLSVKIALPNVSYLCDAQLFARNGNLTIVYR